MKKTLTILIVLVMSFALMNGVLAHDGDTLTEAEHMVTEQVPCENLSEEQLEMIGDYYMEQMHPGEAHEQMDAMMGGESSETLKEMHINMAKRFYCGDTAVTGCPMMGDMMNGGMMQNGMMGGGMMGEGMMQGRMMGNYPARNYQASGMMSGWSSWFVINNVLFTVLLLALLVLIIFAILKLAGSRKK